MARKFHDTSIEEISLMTMDAFSIIAMVGIIMAVVFSMLAERLWRYEDLQQFQGNIHKSYMELDSISSTDIQEELSKALGNFRLDKLKPYMRIRTVETTDTMMITRYNKLMNSIRYEGLDFKLNHINDIIYAQQGDSLKYILYRFILGEPVSNVEDNLGIILLLELGLIKDEETDTVEISDTTKWRGLPVTKIYIKADTSDGQYLWAHTFSRTDTDTIFDEFLMSYNIKKLDIPKRIYEKQDIELDRGLWDFGIKPEVFTIGDAYVSEDPIQIKEIKKMFQLTDINLLEEDIVKVGYFIHNPGFGVSVGDILYFEDSKNNLVFSVWVNLYNLEISITWQSQVYKTKFIPHFVVKEVS